MGCPRLLIETLPLPVPLERPVPVWLPVWLERPVMFDLLVPVPVLDTEAEAEETRVIGQINTITLKNSCEQSPSP